MCIRDRAYSHRLPAEEGGKDRGGLDYPGAVSYTHLDVYKRQAPYSACKAGVSSRTRTFAAELAKDKIRVVAYVPGMTATEISAKNIEKNGARLMRDIPMQRFGAPEDCAKLMVFLASDNASYINCLLYTSLPTSLWYYVHFKALRDPPLLLYRKPRF